MKKLTQHKWMIWSLGAGIAVGVIAMLVTVGIARAAASPVSEPAQIAQTTPPPPMDVKACSNCHSEVVDSWANSPHAHAFDDEVFQDRWHAMNDRGDCLLCHTTDYRATTGEFAAEGVSCEACHGEIPSTHPLQPVEVRDDSEYCGSCHTTTLGEWRLTGHSHADVGCTDCHDSHSQQALFENPDDMCINCHQDAMSPYLEDLHGQSGIGCVDCHALVIPPETPPEDGIVPTGHTFTITPATCVACHTDALHSGFSLPGYESGAKAAANNTSEEAAAVVEPQQAQTVHTPAERIQMLENQVNTLTASTANSNMTILFQGGVVGLVLGGSTAWVVANNVRRGRKEMEEEAEGEK